MVLFFQTVKINPFSARKFICLFCAYQIVILTDWPFPIIDIISDVIFPHLLPHYFYVDTKISIFCIWRGESNESFLSNKFDYFQMMLWSCLIINPKWQCSILSEIKSTDVISPLHTLCYLLNWLLFMVMSGDTQIQLPSQGSACGENHVHFRHPTYYATLHTILKKINILVVCVWYCCCWLNSCSMQWK